MKLLNYHPVLLSLIIMTPHLHISNAHAEEPKLSAVNTFDLIQLNQIISDNTVVLLDNLPSLLPEFLRKNFILKHGNNLLGLRGHELDIINSGQAKSISANATAPRLITFDEVNGLALSFNGGVDSQRLSEMQNLDTQNQVKPDHKTPQYFGIKNEQVFPHRLDILSFDSTRKTFELSKIDFDSNDYSIKKDSSCIACHGPSQRPIFSMYPDWPQFYGSDNDELVGYSDEHFAEQNNHQQNEFDNYKLFRRNMLAYPELYKRYTPFYNQEEVTTHLTPIINKLNSNLENLTPDIQKWQSYPYRPLNTIKPWASASRAFAFRPALRFGIVQNRNMSLKVTEDLITSRTTTSNQKSELKSVFDQFGLYFFYHILQCNPKIVNSSNTKVTDKQLLYKDKTTYNSQIALGWKSKLITRLKFVQEAEISLRNKLIEDARLQNNSITTTDLDKLYPDDLSTIYVTPTYTKQGNLNYKQLWALFQIMVRDIDIRLSRNHSGYSAHLDKTTKLYSATGELKNKTNGDFKKEGLMDIGYIDNYFNSYFDGSATIDELIAAQLYTYYSKKNMIKTKVNLVGLTEKYSKFTDRFLFDKEFFAKMDYLSQWLPIPIPAENISSLYEQHHRETYNDRYALQHNSLCIDLGNLLIKGP